MQTLSVSPAAGLPLLSSYKSQFSSKNVHVQSEWTAAQLSLITETSKQLRWCQMLRQLVIKMGKKLKGFSNSVHYRCSSPRLPKATSTPSAGSAPGANNALTNKCQQKIQNNLKGETRPQNAWEARESNSKAEADRHVQCAWEQPGWVGGPQLVNAKKKKDDLLRTCAA